MTMKSSRFGPRNVLLASENTRTKKTPCTRVDFSEMRTETKAQSLSVQGTRLRFEHNIQRNRMGCGLSIIYKEIVLCGPAFSCAAFERKRYLKKIHKKTST